MPSRNVFPRIRRESIRMLRSPRFFRGIVNHRIANPMRRTRGGEFINGRRRKYSPFDPRALPSFPSSGIFLIPSQRRERQREREGIYSPRVSLSPRFYDTIRNNEKPESSARIIYLSRFVSRPTDLPVRSSPSVSRPSSQKKSSSRTAWDIPSA